MDEFWIPKSDTNQVDGSEPNKYLEKVFMPQGIDPEKERQFHQDILQKVIYKEAGLEKKFDNYAAELEERVANYKTDVEEYKKELHKQSSRNVEIIGIFSAILALIIIDVSVIKSVTSFLPAILLIVALAAVMAIFAILMHILFHPEEDKSRLKSRILWAPIAILIILIILGICSQTANWQWAHWLMSNSNS